MNKNNNKNILILILIVAVIMGSFTTGMSFAEGSINQEPISQEPERQIWQGEYTIFQYTQNGWSNHFFVTEFYEEDGYLFYRLKDHPEEYMLIRAEEFLAVPGWVEDVDELMKYGFWEPMESDW